MVQCLDRGRPTGCGRLEGIGEMVQSSVTLRSARVSVCNAARHIGKLMKELGPLVLSVVKECREVVKAAAV